MMTRFNFNNTALRICVDSIANGRLSGRIYSCQLAEPVTFSDTGILVLKMEEILDARNFPKAFQRSRKFASGKTALPVAADEANASMPEKAFETAAGAKTTFEVYILSRQSSSWQGKIDWLDGNPPKSFASDLEFIRLIDDKATRIK